MVRAVKETYSRNSERTERQVIADFARPDLLILDEIGRQHGTDTERLIIFDVINARYLQNKPSILITNRHCQSLEKRWMRPHRTGCVKVVAGPFSLTGPVTGAGCNHGHGARADQ